MMMMMMMIYNCMQFPIHHPFFRHPPPKPLFLTENVCPNGEKNNGEKNKQKMNIYTYPPRCAGRAHGLKLGRCCGGVPGSHVANRGEPPDPPPLTSRGPLTLDQDFILIQIAARRRS